MLVSDAVGAALTELGTDTVFGVVGSGNFHVTNALIARGARFIAARHENGAASMADGWARLSGRPGVLSLHQGPGLTNALTAITEAAKSRTPLLVLAADVSAAARTSNFRIDVAAISRAVGATPARLHSPALAVNDAVLAYRTAAAERRCVILTLPLDVQAGECSWPGIAPGPDGGRDTAAPAGPVAALAGRLRRAARPVFIAGRGARASGPAARAELERLADGCGALLATSAAAKGLFRGSPWDLDVSGGFASPLAADLIRGADLVVGWGCALNMWTLRHGSLIGPEASVVQVDREAAAIGAHQRVDLGVTGDVAAVARAVADLLAADTGRDETGPGEAGYRSAALREQIAREGRWRDVPFTDESYGGRIDPRTLSIALDDLLPAERIVAVDSGNFMGYPSMYLTVPDADGFTFTQAFQSVGLGLASAIGSAIARPDRLTVAALGDGGALMGVSELETAVRLGLPMMIVVYDDEAYGAEVHHFGPAGYPLETVVFPAADLAAIGRGFGCAGVTVRGPADFDAVRAWLAGPRDRPMVIDAKVSAGRAAWWLEEAFRGH
jgi:thiamine pyrophosphate-dependent acetolactate synthase large subunit-like protein